jgi:hypothetical protein
LPLVRNDLVRHVEKTDRAKDEHGVPDCLSDFQGKKGQRKVQKGREREIFEHEVPIGRSVKSLPFEKPPAGLVVDPKIDHIFLNSEDVNREEEEEAEQDEE